MLRDAPRLDAVLDEFAHRVDGSLFVAHNARFDGEFLLRAAHRRGATGADLSTLERRLCTLRMSRRLDPDRTQSHRLTDVCHRYGVSLDRPHEARADARATAAVLPHLLTAHSVVDVDDLEPFMDRPDAPRRSWRESPPRAGLRR
jgi:DNA polymerase-3 subunit epsilon